MKSIINIVNDLFHANSPAANTDDVKNVSEFEIRRAIRELEALSDRDLSDMGLARSEIKHAVRYGRKAA
ncbi:MAG: hypothetical protein RL122_2161 [Pseudomonadota bacterium]|uniref:DUF1127 domain-containing protein n=1 Tax=Thiothrix fructosivorans TaxID=111770 RepID=A0A8B0SPZ3_9GAMM|nr:DUF1127 domain-containing protein [Thiothrix fructosivorans]MBO0614188.1 DUF1127 domain-containing protein [Thiothrix fructosivorans]QTX12670.1 DUF1127 domain-containing protein [Thiothrix fructosivorans]